MRAAVDDYMIMNVTLGHYSNDQIEKNRAKKIGMRRKSILKDTIKFIILLIHQPK